MASTSHAKTGRPRPLPAPASGATLAGEPGQFRKGRLVMVTLRCAGVLFCLLAAPLGARAGLHYSGETYAELPSQWRGFLLDQRTLRNLAIKGTRQNPESPGRTHYLEVAARLENQRTLSAAEAADLRAICPRLGDACKAITVRP